MEGAFTSGGAAAVPGEIGTEAVDVDCGWAAEARGGEGGAAGVVIEYA